jgi:hypothetical protein
VADKHPEQNLQDSRSQRASPGELNHACKVKFRPWQQAGDHC